MKVNINDFVCYNKNHCMRSWERKDESSIIKYHLDDIMIRMKETIIGQVEMPIDLDFEYIIGREFKSDISKQEYLEQVAINRSK